MVASPLVIGIGNLDRGDDAVGLIVARHLARRCPAGARIVEHGGESTSLLDCLGSADCAFVVDACMAGGPPGTISRFDVTAAELPAIALACSTHGMGLAHAIELARALGCLPRHCVVYAIEGQRYDIGAALSPEVAAAAQKVADRIGNELQSNNQDAAAPPVQREQI
ncbi:MAG: hydrogenase maturation protease [Xanthobacteraceae bacterium]